MIFPSTSPRRRFNPWAPAAVFISAGLQGLTDSLLQPAIMLSTLVFLLGGSTYEIAAFAVSASLCWSCGRGIINPLLRLTGGSLQLAIGGLILRTGGVILIGYLGYRLQSINPGDAIAGLITCFALYQLGSMTTAFTINPRMAAAYGPTKRPRIFLSRAITAACTAVIAGIVAQRVFGSSSLALSQAGKYLLLLAALSGVTATWFLVQVPKFGRRDYPGAGTPAIDGFSALLRNTPMRRYLGYRTLLGFSTLADPFIVIFVLRQQGFALKFVGLALFCFAVVQLIGAILVPRWASTHSSVRLLQIATFCKLAFLMTAVSIPALATSSFVSGRWGSHEIAPVIFSLAFGLWGISACLHGTANQRYLLELTAPGHPRAAIAATNGILGILSFAPLVGAALINRFSWELAITTGGAIAFLAFIASALLVDSRPKTRTRLGVQNKDLRRRRSAN